MTSWWARALGTLSVPVIVVMMPAPASAQGPQITLNPVARPMSELLSGEPGLPGARPTFFTESRTSPPPQATAPQSNDTEIAIYPVLIWVPSFKATTGVPPFPDVPDGPDQPGETGSAGPSINGAALAGFSIKRSFWRIDADGIWAALTTTRDTPLLDVDLDVIYGHVTGGVRVFKGLYATAGVRRVALKYDIGLEDRPRFVRKPGLWDPLVGLAWHSSLGSIFDLHVMAEGGGFDVGADVDLAASVRVDVKFARHVGLTLGYSVLYLKVSDTVLTKTLEVKQTLQGPVLGLGIYF